MFEAWWSDWSLPSSSAFALVQRGLGAVVFLVGLEQWACRRAFAEGGVWAWSRVRKVVWSPRPSALLDAVGGAAGTSILILGKILLGAALALLPGSGPLASVGCCLTSVLLSVRFLGRENGAADAMINVVATTVMVVELLRLVGVEAAQAGVVFLAAQTTLSYLSAGIAKVKSPTWRRGDAPAACVTVGRYQAPRWAIDVLGQPGVSGLASACVIGWQLSFPLALWSPAWCIGATTAGAIFHVLNGLVFGLHRFLWAWIMTYPALWSVSTMGTG